MFCSTASEREDVADDAAVNTSDEEDILPGKPLVVRGAKGDSFGSRVILE